MYQYFNRYFEYVHMSRQFFKYKSNTLKKNMMNKIVTFKKFIKYY